MDLRSTIIANLVKVALQEDIGKGDLTSLGCLEPKPMKATIVAKSSGYLSGLHPAIAVFDKVDSANYFRPFFEDGNSFEPGEVIAELEGFNQTLLASERTALNFMAHLSGIATLTAKFVKAVAGTDCQILDTRKTTPGMRMLEKEAVVHGGGKNHRHGLYDMVLIKDNHIASVGSIKDAVELARSFLNTSDFRLQFALKGEEVEIEVEVCSEDQLREAAEVCVKRLLLDNQSLESLARMVELARNLDPAIKLEASGNMSLDRVADVAATGVDFISVGALTHSAPVSDFSMRVTC